MINVDDMKELEKAPSFLPSLYSAWMAQVLQGPFSKETKATCANCVICQPATTAAEPEATYFYTESK